MPAILIYHAHADALDLLPIEAASLDEATLKTEHGVYTVMRIYPGRRVLRIDHHLARMRRSAALLDSPYPLTDEWLRGMMRRAVTDAESQGVAESRVRLTVPFTDPDSALILVEPFQPPPASTYERGVEVGLVDDRRDAPKAKNTRFIERRQQIVAAQTHTFYEILLCAPDGTILEGASSNFYAVLDRDLHTAEEGVLHGIARGMVLEVAEGLIPVNRTPVHPDEIAHLSEAMLSSASRGVIPIVKIGDTVINGGEVGPIARALRARYDGLVEAELEDL